MLKTCNCCKESKPRSSFTIDARNKDGLQGKCNSCRSAAKKRSYDPVAASARSSEYYSKNSDRIKERQRTSRAPRDPVKTLASTRRRHIAKLNRTPKWADSSEIEEVYRDAAEFRKAGVNVHVDHVIPLRAKLVSGLHVANNLTIKLASWNDSKGNKYVIR